MTGLFNWALRLVLGVLHFLFEKMWTEPTRSRGWLWTLSFWAAVGCAIALLHVIPRESWRPVAGLAAAALVMRWENKKPKRLGRPLPYRRRR